MNPAQYYIVRVTKIKYSCGKLDIYTWRILREKKNMFCSLGKRAVNVRFNRLGE